MKLRHALLVADPTYKKKKYAWGESDLDEDTVVEHGEQCKAREIEKAEKKRAKENEKLVEGSLAIPRRTRAYSIRG
jgi:DNA topoisomerase-1